LSTWAFRTLAQIAAKQKTRTARIGYSPCSVQLYPAISRPARNTQAVDKIVPTLELSPKAVTPYVGEYRFQDEVTKVSFEKDKLIAISSFGKCELRALTQTKLYCIDIEVALQFNQDKHGRVVGVTFKWADHDEGIKR